MSELRREAQCSPWIHDLLDLVEQNMLLVLSQEHQRETAPHLVQKLQAMDKKTKTKSYCQAKKREDKLSSWVPPPGVLSELNKASQQFVLDAQPRLNTYTPDEGQLSRSLMPNESE